VSVVRLYANVLKDSKSESQARSFSYAEKLSKCCGLNWLEATVPVSQLLETRDLVKVLLPRFDGSLSSEKDHDSARACECCRPCLMANANRHWANLLRPIVTYGGKGVSKMGVLKSQHAIAFHQRKEPETPENERPRHAGELPMLPGIKINPRNPKEDKVDPKARIDFARTYTVEHNVKVYDFGTVSEAYMARLADQWIRVLLQDNNATALNTAISDNTEEADDPEEAADGEEEEEEGEYAFREDEDDAEEEDAEAEEAEPEEEEEQETEEQARRRARREKSHRRPTQRSTHGRH
jgi:hypothetical protein